VIFGDSFHIVFVHCIVLIHCHCAVNIAIICLIILIKIFTKPNLTDIGFQIVTEFGMI